MSGSLAERGVSIEELHTEIVSGAMSAEHLFKVKALLLVPKSVSNDELRRGLEALANEMMVDIALGEHAGRADARARPAPGAAPRCIFAMSARFDVDISCTFYSDVIGTSVCGPLPGGAAGSQPLPTMTEGATMNTANALLMIAAIASLMPLGAPGAEAAATH